MNVTPDKKFLLIKSIIEKYNFKRMISYLCKMVGVSRSGYYNYFSAKSIKLRLERDAADGKVKDIIENAYHFKKRKKGARQIKMTLEFEFDTIYNLKRIRRIMKKYNIICPIRRANPYRRIMKATKEHSVVSNLLNRNFKQETPGKVLLTDITYLFYGKSQKAYLSTIKDGSTNEILAHVLSKSLSLEIATETINKLLLNDNFKVRKDSFIHSDYTEENTMPKFLFIHCGRFSYHSFFGIVFTPNQESKLLL